MEEENRLKVIDMKNLNELLAEALNNGDVLATPKESQMLMSMTGVSITSKPRKDGRYQGYILQDGEKKYAYGRTREEVAIKIKVYLKEGIPKRKPKKKPQSPILSDWLDKWIELYKKPNLKPTSLNTLKNVLLTARNVLGGKPISEITTDEIQAFLLSMSAERLRDLCRFYLSQAFEKAKLQGIIKNNPCDALEIKKHVSKKRHALTLEQQEEFLTIIQGHKYEALCVFLLQTGARIGEALAVTETDIDNIKKTVSINKNAVFIKSERIIQDSTKTEAGARTIPLPQLSYSLLAQKNQSDTFLFDYTYNSIRLYFKRISETLGFNVTPHILRHTYATRLEESGIPPKIKQYLMGHAKLDVTQNTYTDTQKEYVESVSDRIISAFDTK